MADSRPGTPSEIRRLAIFSAQFLPSYGGVEQFTAHLTQQLAAMGIEVTVVAANSRGVEPVEELGEGAKVFRLPCHALAGGSFPTLRHDALFKELWHEVASIPYDAVLVNTRFYTLSLAGLSLAQEQEIHAIVLDHGSSHLGFGKPWLDWLVRDYEHIITDIGKRYGADYYGISTKSADWLGHFGIEARGALNNAIDVPAFRELDSERDFRAELNIPAGDLVVAFVGRLVVSKGIQTVRDTACELEHEQAAIHVIVAGDGPDRSLLAGDPPNNIHLLGRLERPDVSALFRQSDVFFLPTRTEGFCTALLEAAAWETPSVVTDVGGAREVIPNASYGTVLEGTEPTVGECCDVLRWYAEHREEIPAQGARCRELVEREYSWPATAGRVLQALSSRGLG